MNALAPSVDLLSAPIPAVKTVVLASSPGSGPTNCAPATGTISEACATPSSASPLATTFAAWAPGTNIVLLLNCSALNELAPVYGNETGDKLSIEYALAADLKKRILDGETADVIILTRAMMDDLQRQNKLAATDLSNVAGTPVSVVARAGAPKPDISSVDALKETLLAARSIVSPEEANPNTAATPSHRTNKILVMAFSAPP
jgi:hypothetical protein